MAKKILVFGGTGSQAKGLVDKLISDPDYTPVIVTRNVESDKAKAFTSKGAEAVSADINDPSSIKAEYFDGVYGVYAVTDFWGSAGMKAENEEKQAKAIADAIEKYGKDVKHVIWSTLEESTALKGIAEPLEKGYYVPHFDSKHNCNGLFPKEKTTMLYTSFYYENMYMFGICNDGVVTLPNDKIIPAISSVDIGKCSYGIFKDPSLIGKDVYIAGDNLFGQGFVDTLKEVSGGKTFVLNKPSYKEMAGYPFPGAHEFANMYQLWDEYPPFLENRADTSKAKAINPELITFKEWCLTNKEIVDGMAKKE